MSRTTDKDSKKSKDSSKTKDLFDLSRQIHTLFLRSSFSYVALKKKENPLEKRKPSKKESTKKARSASTIYSTLKAELDCLMTKEYVNLGKFAKNGKDLKINLPEKKPDDEPEKISISDFMAYSNLIFSDKDKRKAFLSCIRVYYLPLFQYGTIPNINQSIANKVRKSKAKNFYAGFRSFLLDYDYMENIDNVAPLTSILSVYSLIRKDDSGSYKILTKEEFEDEEIHLSFPQLEEKDVYTHMSPENKNLGTSGSVFYKHVQDEIHVPPIFNYMKDMIKALVESPEKFGSFLRKHSKTESNYTKYLQLLEPDDITESQKLIDIKTLLIIATDSGAVPHYTLNSVPRNERITKEGEGEKYTFVKNNFKIPKIDLEKSDDKIEVLLNHFTSSDEKLWTRVGCFAEYIKVLNFKAQTSIGRGFIHSKEQDVRHKIISYLRKQLGYKVGTKEHTTAAKKLEKDGKKAVFFQIFDSAYFSKKSNSKRRRRFCIVDSYNSENGQGLSLSGTDALSTSMKSIFPNVTLTTEEVSRLETFLEGYIHSQMTITHSDNELLAKALKFCMCYSTSAVTDKTVNKKKKSKSSKGKKVKSASERVKEIIASVESILRLFGDNSPVPTISTIDSKKRSQRDDVNYSDDEVDEEGEDKSESDDEDGKSESEDEDEE